MPRRNISATEWALETLTPEERALIETYYGLGRTPEEIDIDPVPAFLIEHEVSSYFTGGGMSETEYLAGHEIARARYTRCGRL